MKNKILLIISVFTFNLTVSQDLKLPTIFSNNMIMQQQSVVSIWGWSKPNSKVSINVSWNKKKYKTKSNNSGEWLLNILTPKAGEAHEISITTNSDLIHITNVLMGEIWIASGQSNMQMNLNGYMNEPIIGANYAIANSKNSHIRFFTVERNTSKTPLDNLKGKWSVSNQENSPFFSAVAYSFAKYLNKTLDIPIGIIHTSWGGTPAEAWTDSQSLLSDFKKSEIKNYGEIPSDEPSSLFNAMINPLVKFRIKGAIWYQGESNVSRASSYAKLKNSINKLTVFSNCLIFGIIWTVTGYLCIPK